MCKQESLIRMLNPIVTGWGNYYRYGASTEAFHNCDNHIFKLRGNGPCVDTQRRKGLGSTTDTGTISVAGNGLSL
jgi:hypothetical protein